MRPIICLCLLCFFGCSGDSQPKPRIVYSPTKAAPVTSNLQSNPAPTSSIKEAGNDQQLPGNPSKETQTEPEPKVQENVVQDDRLKIDPNFTPKVMNEVATEEVSLLRVQLDRGVYFEKKPGEIDGLRYGLQDRLSALADACGVGLGAWPAVPRQSFIVKVHRPRNVASYAVLEGYVTAARFGWVEQFLTLSSAGKDYESILTSPMTSSLNLKLALIAAGAKPGQPATFINENRDYDFKPATGDIITVLVEYYTPAGKRVTVPGQTFLINSKKEPMAAKWVFAGSLSVIKVPDPNDETKLVEFFPANTGRVICVTNFAEALLDLNMESKDGDPQMGVDYRANPEYIPNAGTPIRVILYPEKKP